jgi:hypothetical protein
MASCGCSTLAAAIPPLHYLSAAFGLLVTLVVGVYYFLLHVPTFGLSTWVGSILLARAGKPVFGTKQPKPPDIAAEHAQQQQQQHRARMSSKRKRGRDSQRQRQLGSSPAVVTAVSIGSAPSRAVLFVLLCLLSSCSSAAAMQVSSSLLGNLAASL